MTGRWRVAFVYDVDADTIDEAYTAAGALAAAVPLAARELDHAVQLDVKTSGVCGSGETARRLGPVVR